MIENTLVKVSLISPLDMKIESSDKDYMNDIKYRFTFPVPGYQYMPAFKKGRWSGKTSLFTKDTLPYGLLFDFVKIHKKFYENVILEVSDEVKNLFMGKKLEPIYDLKHYPYDYQDDCIVTALKHKRCILHVSVASGKSLIVTMFIKTLLENFNKQYLVIVPTVNLVEQLYSDMIDYGIDSNIIGRVHANIQEPDKSIVISTWQSLSKRHKWLPRFHGVVVDECHTTGGSLEIRKILSKAINADYRLGVTGTLPGEKLNLFNIKSYLGPVVKKYSTAQLSKAGYVSKCNVLAHVIKHNINYQGEYFDVRCKVVNNIARMGYIKDIINNIQDNVLILVNLVEKEGKILEEYLIKNLPDREVVFIYGETDVKTREQHRLDFDNRKNKVVIATYPILKIGVNIPSLKYIIFCSPLKSKISVLQSVGRTLRKYMTKTEGSYIIDLIDDVTYLRNHGDIRLEYYEREKFSIKKLTGLLSLGINMM